MNMLNKRDFLNHYTRLKYLYEILENRCIFLTDPDKWEDKNDSYFINKYKKSNVECQSIRIICFSKARETIYHWNAFADDGVCIEFSKSKLLELIPKRRYIKGNVKYEYINDVDSQIKPA